MHFSNICRLAAILFVACNPTPQSTRSQETVEIEATTFLRGAEVSSKVYERGRKPWYGPDWDEGPKHQVKIDTYRIAVNQVTQAEFARFMPEYRRRLEKRGIAWSGNAPAVFVSWNEASEYCNWLAKRSGKAYRLPTESEWELAASKAGPLKMLGIEDGVKEWCFDWWEPYPSESAFLENPGGPKHGVVRSIRDGGGGSIEELVETGARVVDYRVTDRSASVADDRRANLGFRVAIGNSPNISKAVTAPLNPVSEKKCTWEDQPGDTPHFRAGGKFIDESDVPSTLPYWNRHHVPSLTWCDNGDLLATTFTAPFDNSDQMAVLMTRLPYRKRKWEPPRLFFSASDHNTTSSALFNTQAGEIHHYNGIGDNLCENFSMIKRVSRDNGKSWSGPQIVHRFSTNPATPENPFGKSRLWPHMDIKTVSLDGHRLLLMSTDVGAGNSLGSSIFTSNDLGDSWLELTRTGWHSEKFAIENEAAGWIAGIHAPVERLEDGSLIAIGRSNDIRGFSPMSRSADFGKSWTYTASPFPPILSGQRPVLIRLSEGTLLFVSFTDSTTNWRKNSIQGMKFVDSKGSSARGSGMFAALSFDDGQTWPVRKLIPNSAKQPWKSRYSGYLSCVQTPDRLIHLISSRFYYQFNLAWLKQPMPPQNRQ